MPQSRFESIHRFDIIELLIAYQKFPCLWRKCDPDFKNRVKREEAERYLLQYFNFGSTKALRQKIRSIRGTYNQERNKVRSSLRNGIGKTDIYKPKLIWFDVADSFLRLNELENESSLNLVTEEEDCLLTKTEREEENTSVQPRSEPSTSRPLPISNSQKHPTSQSQPTASQPPTQTNSTSQKRNREKGGPQNLRKVAKLANSLDDAVNVLKEIALRTQPTNEFTIFGSHVASQLQKLPLAEALQLQADIQSLITSARLQSLQNNSSLLSEQFTTNCSTSEDSSHNRSVTPDASNSLIIHDDAPAVVDAASGKTIPLGLGHFLHVTETKSRTKRL